MPVTETVKLRKKAEHNGMNDKKYDSYTLVVPAQIARAFEAGQKFKCEVVDGAIIFVPEEDK